MINIEWLYIFDVNESYVTIIIIQLKIHKNGYWLVTER